MLHVYMSNGGACIHVACGATCIHEHGIVGAASPHLTIAGYEATIHEHQMPLEVKSHISYTYNGWNLAILG